MKKSIKPIIVAVIALVAAIAGYYGFDVSPEVQAAGADAACSLATGC